jgi:hypothetical protein
VVPIARLSAAFDILTRGADKAASDIDHVGNSSEKTSGKIEKVGRSARLLGSTFTGASNQALGPLQEIADKFDVIERAGASATTKVGGKLLGLGAAGLGAGSFLSTLASREQQGQQQLQASIAAVGKSYEDFAPQIEAAVKAGEHFGNQNATTLDALNRLTLTTHDPTEALKDLAVAQDVAAAKHVPLQKAAEIVGLVFNGSARSGKQFGLQLEQITGVQQALTKAQHDSATASERVKTAQENYNDKLAVYQQTVKPTLAQQQALYRAHEAVGKAQDDASKAAGRLKTAQEKANDSAAAGARNVAQLARITKGQGEAAADSFAGHMRALGARVEGTAAQIGEKYGSAINTVSLGTIAVGTLIETGFLPKLGSLITGLGRTGAAFEALRDVEVTTSAEGAAAVEANAVKAEAAMAAEGAAAEGLGAKLKVLAGSALGIPGLAVGASALAFDKLGQYAHAHPKGFTGAATKDNPLLNAVFGDHPNGPDPIDNSLLNTPGLHPHGVQTDDAYDAKTSATLGQRLASVGQRAAAIAKSQAKKPTADQSFEDWMKLMGLGDPANAQKSAAAAEAAKAAKQVAVDAATAVRDQVKAQVDAAKDLLRDVVQQSAELRKSIHDSITTGSQITDVFGTGPNLNANHAFGDGSNFTAVKRFFEDRLTKLRRFAAEINALVHKGLDPTIVAQIAQAGVDQGGRLADALAGSSKSQLGEINSLNSQVNKIADSAGQRVADVQFKAQLAADKKNADMLGRKLDEANKHLRAISREKPGAATDQRAQAFMAGA